MVVRRLACHKCGTGALPIVCPSWTECRSPKSNWPSVGETYDAATINSPTFEHRLIGFDSRQTIFDRAEACKDGVKTLGQFVRSRLRCRCRGGERTDHSNFVPHRVDHVRPSAENAVHVLQIRRFDASDLIKNRDTATTNAAVISTVLQAGGLHPVCWYLTPKSRPVTTFVAQPSDFAFPTLPLLRPGEHGVNLAPLAFLIRVRRPASRREDGGLDVHQREPAVYRPSL